MLLREFRDPGTWNQVTGQRPGENRSGIPRCRGNQVAR